VSAVTTPVRDTDGVVHLRDDVGLLCGLDFMPGLVRLVSVVEATVAVTCEGCLRAGAGAAPEEEQ
jgi:hypothetical protein